MKIIIAFVYTLFVCSAFAADTESSNTEQQLIAHQRAAVDTLVSPNGQTVVVAVDGLCCATCGIGVKKKLQKLSFVARNGVLLDIKNSMAVVSLKQANHFDQDAMVKAVRKAGYKPVRLYSFDGQSIHEAIIPSKS